jgi:hypothetical protein
MRFAWESRIEMAWESAVVPWKRGMYDKEREARPRDRPWESIGGSQNTVGVRTTRAKEAWESNEDRSGIRNMEYGIVCALTASPNESVERSHCEKIDEQMIDEQIERDPLETVVTHGVAGVAAVEDPTEIMGELIRGVDDAGG